MKKLTALLMVAAFTLFGFACKREENTNIDTAGTETSAMSTDAGTMTDTSGTWATSTDTSGTLTTETTATTTSGTVGTATVGGSVGTTTSTTTRKP